MNIGIRMHDAAEGTLKERAGFVRAQGFSCVHLALSKTIDPKLMDPAAATPGLAAQVKHDLGDIDLAVLGCYLNLCSPDLESHEKTVEIYKAHLRFAKRMGALLVGKIVNHHQAAKVIRGQEKGYFQFGGSTGVVLLQKNAAVIDEDLLANSLEGVETIVKMGEVIGKSLCV